MNHTISLPHNELIVGMTGSGKTHYLIWRLTGILRSNPTLQRIFIVCPTLEHNRAYNVWMKDGDTRKVTFINCSQDEVCIELREIIGRCKSSPLLGTEKALKTLVVLDDCAHGQSVKGRTSELVALAFTARHLGMGTVVVTQQLTSIAKAYRENATSIIMYYNTNNKDTNTFYDEFMNGISISERETIQAKLKKIQYSYLAVQLTHPYGYVLLKDGKCVPPHTS